MLLEQTDDLGGTPLFPFQPVRTEMNAPFAQNLYFHFVVFLCHHVNFFLPVIRFQVGNEGKKAIPFDTENFRISIRKF